MSANNDFSHEPKIVPIGVNRSRDIRQTCHKEWKSLDFSQTGLTHPPFSKLSSETFVRESVFIGLAVGSAEITFRSRNQPPTLIASRTHSLIVRLLVAELHAKTLLSLHGAVLGTLQSARAGVALIARGLATAQRRCA